MQTKPSDIFNRVFRRYTRDKLNPGKVTLLNLLDGEDEYIVGAFTENTGGSISFFPDFSSALTKKYFEKKGVQITEEIQDFDHFTLNKDFGKRGHITNSEKKHSMQHDPVLLSNGDYHWFTVLISDVSKLNTLSNKITITEDQDDSTSSTIDIVRNSIRGAIKNNFPYPPTENQFGCIQVLLIKKEQSINNGFAFCKGILEAGIFQDNVTNFISPEDVYSTNYFFPTLNNFGFNILILFFTLDGVPKDSATLVFGTNNINNPGY